MSDNLNTAPDLTDPAVVARECGEMAAGMRQQAEAALTRSAAGGHPHPHYFFGKAAALFDAAAALLKNTPAPGATPATAAQQTDQAPADEGKSAGKPRR